jgi:hypothetical protein
MRPFERGFLLRALASGVAEDDAIGDDLIRDDLTEGY